MKMRKVAAVEINVFLQLLRMQEMKKENDFKKQKVYSIYL